MATKLGRKETPSGVDITALKYQGRPSKEQDDFGPEVGLADMVCVNQFGDANNNKYYHAGVVKSASRWYVYLEWGRITGGKSWGGGFNGQDFQFVECLGEEDARDFFAKQCRDKNVKRLEKKRIGFADVWVGKAGKDGYVVQRLATRERGLPDAYLIKDDEGLQKKPVAAATSKTKKAKAPRSAQAHPQVVGLARSLVGGTVDYARSAQKSTGIVPTMAAIVEVRDRLIPDALHLLAKIGPDEDAQLKDPQLQQLSTYVATIVPRPIPRTGDPAKVILSQSNIFSIQQDLDAFEAALKNEDFEVDAQADNDLDPTAVLGRELSWIDPASERGRWVVDAYASMSNNRHNIGKVRVLNVFEVYKPDLRKAFVERTTVIARARAGERHVRAGLQPKRTDLGELSDVYSDANVALGIHGTRAVNVQPIMSSNLRLPKSLKGVKITGSAFGHGIYFATDWKKSYGYTGHGSSYWVQGGTIKNRGFFMFLCDLTLGKPYMARSTMWDTVECPRGHDSVFAQRGLTSVENDEHVIFDPHQQDIRYLIEGEISQR